MNVSLLPSSHDDAVRVLVIDDDPSMARATQRVLSRAGYAALTARDGLLARSLVYNFKPALIVLDLQMPFVDGLAMAELLRDLREETPELACPVLVVSGAGTQQMERALALGAHDALPKPFSNEELLRRVARLLASELPIAPAQETRAAQAAPQASA